MSKDIAAAVDRLMDSAASRIYGSCGCTVTKVESGLLLRECRLPENFIPRVDATGGALYVEIGEEAGEAIDLHETFWEDEDQEATEQTDITPLVAEDFYVGRYTSGEIAGAFCVPEFLTSQEGGI